MVYIKVPQNAPEAIYKSVKCKNFLEQHSQVQVPVSAPEESKIQKLLERQPYPRVYKNAPETTYKGLK